MRWNLLLAVCLLVAACGVQPQRESIKTVAAFEGPLPTAEERGALLSLVREIAEAEGLEVSSKSLEELARETQAIPASAQTINAGVWRGDEPEATIGDFADHLGQVWITFARSQDPALADRFRERAMRAIE